MAKKEAANTSSNASKYNERRWSIPSKRAKGAMPRTEKQRYIPTAKRKARNLPTSRLVSVRDICSVKAITQGFTSIRKRLPKVNPKAKREKFLVKNLNKQED